MEEIKKKFSKIYDQYNPKIYRFIWLKVSSPEIAEDLSAEVFLKAWSSFAKATDDKEIENIQAYIYQIARNVIADHYKSKKLNTVAIEETVEIVDTNAPIQEKASISLEMDRIKKALVGINEDYQDLIIWRYLDELSVPEIAKITGKTEENVRVGVHRALEALRTRLEV